MLRLYFQGLSRGVGNFYRIHRSYGLERISSDMPLHITPDPAHRKVIVKATHQYPRTPKSPHL